MDTNWSSGDPFAKVSPAEIRGQLKRILESRTFSNSEHLRRFLEFAVRCALEGTTDQLNGSVLGRVVFDRGPTYDPRVESLVRTEAQRLRRRLRAYYAIEGCADPVSIIFEPGNYVPVFTHLRQIPEPGGPAPHRLNPQTIAVLPFANRTSDPEQEYFCDEITEEIICALSRIPGLNVISWTSVFALKGTFQDVRVAGAHLEAGTVVAGSVRKSGNRLKIFAEMLDTENGEVRWAETFDRWMDGILEAEAEIAQAIARVLQVTLAPPVSRGLARGAPNMDAYLMYLRGRHAWNQMNVEGYRTAIGIFEQAISLFPSYASLYAGLADAYSYLALWGGGRPRDVFPKAQDAAARALEIDPLLPHAHSSLGAARAFYEWKWEESANLARRAIEMEPSYAFGQHIYACCQLAMGRMDEARACFERAVALDPLSITANRALGWSLYLQRRPSAAAKWIQAALVMDPVSVQTHYFLAHVYMSQRRFAAALEEARLSQTDPPHPLGLGVMGACLAHLNRRSEALEITERLSRLKETGYIDPHAQGQVWIALDDTDHALESVRESLEERTPLVVTAGLDPEFDPLRPDPRFDALISRLRP